MTHLLPSSLRLEVLKARWRVVAAATTWRHATDRAQLRIRARELRHAVDCLEELMRGES